jgi:hypothetical protein
MGSDEREKHRRTDGEPAVEPDVEAHMKHHGAVEEGKPEPEDRKDDDGPDVEAHMNKAR